ncbi:MAG: hypothetical protein HZA95_02355 [Candidatus Vogelbacteria bacterium]|nr:hypothetical protein [Candidatus Vogelbacteria bacterium]
MQIDKELEDFISSMGNAIIDGVKRFKQRAGRPLTIEIAGLPNAGKTTVIEIVDHFFRRHRLLTHTPPEGPVVVPKHLKRSTMRYNVALGAYAVEVLTQFTDDPHIDVLLLDRGPFDRACWFRTFAAINKVSSEDAERNVGYLTQNTFHEMIDHAFLLTCSPGIALKREAMWKLVHNEGDTVNKELLAALHQVFPTSFREFSLDKGSVIDTSNLSRQQTAIALLKIVCDKLRSA